MQTAHKTAVVLANLGTPDAPTPGAVRRYLAEFLADRRVVELPRALWLPLLYGVILPFRAKKSAAKYASIWMKEGSPLKVFTERQALRLQGTLGERGHRLEVRYAMRYGAPSIGAQLDALVAAGTTRVLIVSAYPQYSGTTTASLVDAVAAWTTKTRNIPELRFVNRYPTDRGYIAAVAARVHKAWRDEGRAEHLVMSFHGVPQRTVQLGDPYYDECLATAAKLAEHLQLEASQYTVSFQSQFGKAKWVEPATEATVRALAKKGVKRLDVVCPGFIADCLETLEEIQFEVRDAFLEEGGLGFRYIPCVNDDDAWIGALADLVERQTGGW